MYCCFALLFISLQFWKYGHLSGEWAALFLPIFVVLAVISWLISPAGELPAPVDKPDHTSDQ